MDVTKREIQLNYINMSKYQILVLVFVLLSIQTNCEASVCQTDLVETMPVNMNYTNSIQDFKLISTYQALMDIIKKAHDSLKIASFYWFMTADDKFAKHPTSEPGRELMNEIEAAAKRGVKVEIIIEGKDMSMSQKTDIDRIRKFANFKTLNMTAILGGGVMHSKFIIADDKHAYLGSSNFDWRSYTHVKEIGIKFDDCKTLVEDMAKIFKTYQLVADKNNIPSTFQSDLKTNINSKNPLLMQVGDSQVKVYLGASPPEFNENLLTDQHSGRTHDIDGILEVINSATQFIYISVLNYSPETQYTRRKSFVPRIDDALRRAVSERKVLVKILFSNWSNKDQISWYKSLNSVRLHSRNGIHVKLFSVPKSNDFEKSIPFARVKHDKFMVTENYVYVGTSNWTPDYFITTCGVGYVANFTDPSHKHRLLEQSKSTFERDFDSIFAYELQ